MVSISADTTCVASHSIDRQAAARDLIDRLLPFTASRENEGDATGDDAERSVLAAIRNFMSVLSPDGRLYTFFHDGKSHHPLGGGSYAFEKDLAGPVLAALASDENLMLREGGASSSDDGAPLVASNSVRAGTALRRQVGAAQPSQPARPTKPIIVHAGAQPNNSPHAGTLVVFGYAFLFAKQLRDRLCGSPQEANQHNVVVEITFVDTAPVPDSNAPSSVDGIQYQRSHRDVPGALDTHMDDYRDVLDRMSQWSGIPYRTRYQSDFFSHPAIPSLLAWIISHRDRIAPQLSPKYSVLALRAACPVSGCGLAEKHGRLNKYTSTSILFHCPRHGEHAVRLSEPTEVARLEANAPTRNLLRSMTHLLDNSVHHVRVTGLDYAGTYQENFLYRPLAQWSPSTGLGLGRTPHIMYAPLVVDWSGAKLSKSLYVRKDGYRAMKLLGMEALCSYAKLKSEYGPEGLNRLWNEVATWFSAPHMLFRSYSVEYFRGVLEGHSWH